jgi:hypothetical protein
LKIWILVRKGWKDIIVLCAAKHLQAFLRAFEFRRSEISHSQRHFFFVTMPEAMGYKHGSVDSTRKPELDHN